MPIRLLVADDCNACRYGLQAILRTAPEFDVVATTRDGEAVVQLALSLRPDILLLDTDLETVSGITAMERVHHADPGIRGVFFTERRGERWRTLGLDAGAWGWVSKSDDDAVLLQTLRDVHAGRRPRSPGAILETPPTLLLTPREITVLRHAVKGLPSKVIGARIGCRPRTVDKHLESIRHKFAVPHVRAVIPLGILYLRYIDLRAEDGEPPDPPAPPEPPDSNPDPGA